MKNIGVEMSGWIHEDVRNPLPSIYPSHAYKILFHDVNEIACEVLLHDWKLKIVWPRS